MDKVANLLLYAGLTKSEYAALADDARAENAKNLNTYTLVAVLAFAALVVANALVGDLTSINQTYYLIMLGANLVLWVCAHYLLPGRPGLTLPLMYVFTGTLYAFSLAISAIHPELPAVTSIVLLFALPFLICDRPVRLAAMTALAVATLSAMSFACKDAFVAWDDLWNGVSFGAVAILVETLQQRTKYRMLYQGRRIKHLSETDLLTGVHNRNHYEGRLPAYAQDCRTSLACLYVDVNGLHELNDTKGHHAGDVMLQTVAKELVDAFGQAHTYRIGGDEFVCFATDVPEHTVHARVGHIAARLAGQNYYISAGIASQLKSELDMHALTAAAEKAMYQAKRDFYAQEGRDRRRR